MAEVTFYAQKKLSFFLELGQIFFFFHKTTDRGKPLFVFSPLVFYPLVEVKLYHAYSNLAYEIDCCITIIYVI